MGNMYPVESEHYFRYEPYGDKRKGVDLDIDSYDVPVFIVDSSHVIPPGSEAVNEKRLRHIINFLKQETLGVRNQDNLEEEMKKASIGKHSIRDIFYTNIFLKKELFLTNGYDTGSCYSKYTLKPEMITGRNEFLAKRKSLTSEILKNAQYTYENGKKPPVDSFILSNNDKPYKLVLEQDCCVLLLTDEFYTLLNRDTDYLKKYLLADMVTEYINIYGIDKTVNCPLFNVFMYNLDIA